MAVANDADHTLTTLFQIRTAIRTLPLSLLQYFRYLTPRLCCFERASTLCWGTEVKAVSLPEKNMESRIKNTNHIIDKGSIL